MSIFFVFSNASGADARAWLRHERMTVAMVLAEMTHHSAPRRHMTARTMVRLSRSRKDVELVPQAVAVIIVANTPSHVSFTQPFEANGRGVETEVVFSSSLPIIQCCEHILKSGVPTGMSLKCDQLSSKRRTDVSVSRSWSPDQRRKEVPWHEDRWSTSVHGQTEWDVDCCIGQNKQETRA